MNSTVIIVFLSILAGFLLLIVLYQQFGWKAGIRRNLREVNGRLGKILESDSDEMVYVFTEEAQLQELAAQIQLQIDASR